MTTKLETFSQSQLKKTTPDVRPGDTVRVHQKITEGDRERIQIFEGVILAKKHGAGVSGTITVRRVNKGYGVERTFPIHSPVIEKIEVVSRAKVRRAKLYYLRNARGRKGRLKAEAMGLVFEEPEEEKAPEQDTETEEESEEAQEETPVQDKKEAPKEEESEEAPVAEKETGEEKEEPKKSE